MKSNSSNIKRSVISLTFLFFSTILLSQSFTKEELLGKINPATDSLFTKIEKIHTAKPNIYLRKEAYAAFTAMAEAAKKEGITMTIISATRTFDAQKNIWEKKWVRSDYIKFPESIRASEIMKYSSMPGTSRHHWGTDIDINSLENNYFTKGEGKKLYEWMQKNAHSFGFVQTYTDKSNGRTGYEEEKWHWSYIPIAEKMLSAYLTKISYEDLTGFLGSNYAKELKAIEHYVSGIETIPLKK